MNINLTGQWERSSFGMGIGVLEIQMKQQLASCRTNFDLEEDCSLKERRQLQHEWRPIFPSVLLGERVVIDRVEIRDHKNPLMPWVNG